MTAEKTFALIFAVFVTLSLGGVLVGSVANRYSQENPAVSVEDVDMYTKAQELTSKFESGTKSSSALSIAGVVVDMFVSIPQYLHSVLLSFAKAVGLPKLLIYLVEGVVTFSLLYEAVLIIRGVGVLK